MIIDFLNVKDQVSMDPCMKDEVDVNELLDKIWTSTEDIFYAEDHKTIDTACHLNSQMQQLIMKQLEAIDGQLKKHTELIDESKRIAQTETRMTGRLYIHRLYKDPVQYFDKDDLDVEPEAAVDNEEDEDEFDPLFNEDDEEEEEEEVDEEEEEDEEEKERGVDHDGCIASKAWLLTERRRLLEAIHSEAKRLLAYEYLKKNEVWRVWEIDKLAKHELEITSVDRLDWGRISSIYVRTRTPRECLIQWTTQEHPSINKKPWGKIETERLSQLVYELGDQWETIANRLGTNRTISQCFSHYMAAENSRIAKTKKWTQKEDKDLSDAVKQLGNCNWQQVAATLTDRTGQQCLQRWSKSISPAIKRRRWDSEEDKLLKQAVNIYGAGNWRKVQRLLPGRTDMQCRERYMNILTAVNKSKMTEEELHQLDQLVREHGSKWSFIASLLPGRTDNFVMKEYRRWQKEKALREKERKMCPLFAPRKRKKPMKEERVRAKVKPKKRPRKRVA
ncbi:hypothetical protein BDB01DRAFT_802027 [Pilobolus umbonatus]|nr:hypothetical protein BDB01DRAFT_802027 [Pilobolus umbonatus]